jgi:hypothetical protein
MGRLYAATGDGVARIEEGSAGWTAALALGGSRTRCLAVDPTDLDRVFAGGPKGVAASDDGGRAWRDAAPPNRDVFSLAVDVEGRVYAGCEPSALYVSEDGGESWRELEALQAIPSKPTWSFPPRPWTSHVRWIAPSPHEPTLLLVGIELGGLMRSEDGGATWEDHRPGAQRDVHSLAWHPSAEGRAYEAGGGGAAWSKDAGRTWREADGGRDRHYTWAVAPDPADPDRWYVSASTGPFAAHGPRPAEARIYRWDGEGPWEALTEGLADPLDSMPYALATLRGRLVAGLADGRLYASESGGAWARLDVSGEPPAAISALAVG